MAHDCDNLVLEVIREEGFARITELAARLNVSDSTIRRSLDRLEGRGCVRKAVGGAVPATPTESAPPSGVQAFEERRQHALPEKVAIAREAARLVQDGDTVFLGGGSTVGQMAQFLRGRPIQVVTNSLAIAADFEDWPATEVLVTGGYLFPRHRLLSGPLTVRALRELRFTWAFLGAAAFTEREVTDWNVMMAEANREALARAGRKAVLADASKFGECHLAAVCGTAELDYLVTGPLAAAFSERIRSQGCDCLTVGSCEGPTAPGSNGKQPGSFTHPGDGVSPVPIR